MHANCENFISWYLSIQWSDLRIGYTITTVRISRIILWYAMNKLMHVMQLWFFRYMNSHSSHLLRLNYGCKIEWLQRLFSEGIMFCFLFSRSRRILLFDASASRIKNLTTLQLTFKRSKQDYFSIKAIDRSRIGELVSRVF